MKTPNSIDNLEHLTKCPQCNRKYKFNKALVLNEEDDRTTFHLTCDNCQISTLVFVVSGQYGIVSLGMVTDLDRNEAKFLFRNDAISADNVIEVHQLLSKDKVILSDLI